MLLLNLTFHACFDRGWTDDDIPYISVNASSLSEIPKCNPHMTVTAYSIALAEALVRSRRAHFSLRFIEPIIVVRTHASSNTVPTRYMLGIDKN